MSIDTVYTVAGNSGQKVAGNSVQIGCEKYGRTPESVIYDSGLSLSAKAIYAYLSRHVYQGNVVKCGQRLIARKVGANRETVNLALHELQDRGHITIRGNGKARRIYILHSNLFGQKQRAGVESVIVSGPKSAPRKRLATVRSA